VTIEREKIERAIALIKKGSANADYFFEQLKSPAWLEPLAEEKLFAEPYAAIQRGEALSFPVWVPGLYVARMAAYPEVQALVLAILRDLPASDNPRVYEVIADAATALPPEMAKELVSQLIRGIRLPFHLILPARIGAVIVHLAVANCGHEALRLAEALLAIESSPPSEESSEERETSWVHREAKGRIGDWQYGEVLEQVLSPLVRACGRTALWSLSGLLEQAVAAGQLEASKGPDDYSFVWRPSIEHSESRRENIRDSLVSAVRDAAKQILVGTPDDLAEIARDLMGRPTRIFHRLALSLLWTFGDDNTALVSTALRNPADWDDTGLHPEYELLLARFFDRLPPETQLRFLEWIDQGPDLSRFIAFRQKMDGHEPQETDVNLHRDVWIRDHLSVLAPHLTPANRERLAILERIGPSRQVGRPLYQVSVGWRGEQSPLTEDEALSLDWPSLIAKARDWSPLTSNRLDGPSIEGLAASVRQRVSANPSEAIQHLNEATGLGPQYLSAILEALRDAVKKGAVLNWESLLDSMVHIVERAQAADDKNERWRWVCKCAASLIEDSFEAGDASIPVTNRAVVWSVLERLAEDPDPTLEHEARYGGSNMDPATLSLNTVRGETFHAVIRYSLWWRRHMESLPDAATRLQRGFDELPEVRTLLDRHLDPNVDPSLAVRAVYGQWFPWLALIDPGWATGRVNTIFPDLPEQVQLFWAAWGTYVVFSQPYTNVLPILRIVYGRAIGATREGMALDVGMGERPSEHLAEHLMAYYWRGEVTLDAGDLVVAFFTAAAPELRGHALEWTGRILSNLEEPLSSEIKERLTALWEWRRNQAPRATAELREFGWWFASGQMDQAWSLRMLAELLAASVLPEPDHMVVERLAAIAAIHPVEAVQGLDRMIDLASEGWAIHGWIPSARAILEAGLKSGDGGTRERAKRVIDKLGALRFREFGALLRLVERDPAGEA
jgi:hypothetical protein